MHRDILTAALGDVEGDGAMVWEVVVMVNSLPWIIAYNTLRGNASKRFRSMVKALKNWCFSCVSPVCHADECLRLFLQLSSQDQKINLSFQA
jgi:hypothetical protein